MNPDEPSNDAAARKAAERKRKQERIDSAIEPPRSGAPTWDEPGEYGDVLVAFA